MMSGWTHRWFLLGVLALAAWNLLGCGSQRAAPRIGPPVQVGVNSDITWGLPASGVAIEVRLMAAARIAWVRASVDLSDVEPVRRGRVENRYMGPLDNAIRTTRRAGLKVLMEFDRTPYWASADPTRHTDQAGRHWNPYWRYRNFADYAAIVATLVHRYKRMGVHDYELWNEPNYRHFWPSGVDPRSYWQLLKVTYPAVKKADPAATVVMGGLSNLGSYAFLQGLYGAGGHGLYDVANFHIYPEGEPSECQTVDSHPWPGSLCLLQGLRQIMVRHHDRVPVWVTEFGYSTCASGSQCVKPLMQASYIQSTYRLFNTGAYAWVQNAFLYEMHDLVSTGAWSKGLAVLDPDYRPKPGYYALRDAASGSR